jgi:hypothetical protein
MSKAACKKCGGTDFTPGGACRPCKRAVNDAYRAKHAGGGTVKSKAKAKDAKPAAISAPASGADTLVIEHGYGLTAAIDEEYLIVTQHDGETDKDDKICLSRSELRQLIVKFGSWAA